MDTAMTATPASAHASGMPDPEVPERPTRRRYSATDKLRILAEIDKAPRGQTAAILRREGIYSSLLAAWRTQRDQGSLGGLPKRRGPKSDPLVAENAKLRRQNERLRKELENARLVIDVQKKVSRLLEHEQGEDR